MHELQGPPHLQRNFIIIITIINVRFIHVHWPSPSNNRILLQADVITRCTNKYTSASSACFISHPSIYNLLPGWHRASHKMKICEFQKQALTVLFFCVCIYTNAQSYTVSWWCWHCCLCRRTLPIPSFTLPLTSQPNFGSKGWNDTTYINRLLGDISCKKELVLNPKISCCYWHATSSTT